MSQKKNRESGLIAWLLQHPPLTLKDGILYTTLTDEPLSCSVYAALVYTLHHPGHRVTLKEVAMATGFPAQCLKRKFKEELGIPFSKYRENERVCSAVRRMFMGGDPPNFVAIDEWERNMSYLWRVIKKKTGMTPREIFEDGQESIQPIVREWFQTWFSRYQKAMTEVILGSNRRDSLAKRLKWTKKMDDEFGKINDQINSYAYCLWHLPETMYTPRGLAKRGLSKSATNNTQSASERI